MVVTLYFDLLSQPCRAVYLFLKANGIEFEAKHILLTKGEHMSKEISKKNPFHKVPFIDDDGFILTESAAIMLYLARKNKGKVAEHWYGGSDDKLSARINEYLHWQHSTLRITCSNAFYPLFVSKQVDGGFPKTSFDEAKHKSGKDALPSIIQHMEDYFLGGKQYLCGDEISIADLLAVNELEQLRLTGLEMLYLDNKKIAAWVQRVQDRLKPHWSEAMVRRNDLAKAFKNAKK